MNVAATDVQSITIFSMSLEEINDEARPIMDQETPQYFAMKDCLVPPAPPSDEHSQRCAACVNSGRHTYASSGWMTMEGKASLSFVLARHQDEAEVIKCW